MFQQNYLPVCTFCATILSIVPVAISKQIDPIAKPDLVFSELDGLVAVEAEHFVRQEKTDKRAFYLTAPDNLPEVTPDGDPAHLAGASGGAYLEILPDTRRTHRDKLIKGTNFSPQPGQMAVLTYNVHFSTPGRYYVWVRAHSTGSEDNGLHVGIDGRWPASGQRMQWCAGKKTWRWESKQRTEEQHCGEAYKLFIDVEKPGVHSIHFSMREDGFEFDKWIMTTEREFSPPAGVGPKSRTQAGSLPAVFPYVPNTDEAAIAAVDTAKQKSQSLQMPASMFAESDLQRYYFDRDKWLAVNPEKHRDGAAARTFPFPTGVYNVTLRAVGESDGQSTYQLSIDGEELGDFKCPMANEMFAEGPKFNKTWKSVAVTEGAVISVNSQIGSADGQEYSRARWAAVEFQPADNDTLAATAQLLEKQNTPTKASTESRQTRRDSSPTQSVSSRPLIEPRRPDGTGNVMVTGESMMWHNLTITLDGPFAHEQDNSPNPFTDYNMTVTFSHENGKRYVVPGYFAADGDAKNSSAESGTKWRAHFAPDEIGRWSYSISFTGGKNVALEAKPSAKPIEPFNGQTGSFEVAASDKTAPDLRSQGRLQYVGERYLRFAGSGKYFLKVGADAPETLLAYADFDNTHAGNPKKAPIKHWSPHLNDWTLGDPTWKDGKGKALIGAINYLSGKGCNAFSFLTYNAGGDGDNVWPFIHREDKLHYDCSKLDQWATVFEHGTQKGMYLHFKMQETENDDHNRGKNGQGYVPESLDGGNLGMQRMLYCRELIARFGHNLALNWNLGEENTQTHAQQQAMINYIEKLDPYGHNIVVHTFPEQQDKVYGPLLGENSKLTGVSLQNSSLKTTHAQTVKWVEKSEAAGKSWVVAFDESGSAAHAQCPDLGYQGFDGHDRTGKMVYTQHEVRKQTLWGQLMGGGAGCEYYFGYQFAENDILCEDWRSRDQSWDYCRIAINFFHRNSIPFWEMKCLDQLVGNSDHNISKYCFAKPDHIYLVYLPNGDATQLDLRSAKGSFTVKWFNPRTGGELQPGSVQEVSGGQAVGLGLPPTDVAEDWLAVVQAK